MDWNLFTGERAGTDALLLADFAKDAHGTYGADLGCGSGILLLLLLLGDESRRMTGVDIRESAAASARENLRAFALEERGEQRTESATVPELCSASARYLKPGGQFFLVHRRKRESDILAALHNAHLTPVRRRDVFSAPGKRAPIFLMEAVKGAPVSAMRCENVLLRGADGRETEEYRKICHWEA